METKPSNIATKFDAGKARTELLPTEALLEVSYVLSFGAIKYGDYNWLGGMKYSRLLGATLRHVFAYIAGDNKDPESGRSHLAHAACCLLMLITYELNKIGEDDRYVETENKP